MVAGSDAWSERRCWEHNRGYRALRTGGDAGHQPMGRAGTRAGQLPRLL